eukprot:GFYU01005407.1.p1 GENE.GFYU01005407.1~~GFYU01005407.1.p1  ORF type:complete len:389 (-),score=101.15 GFYU01005407.1:179-1345(-)
MSDQEGDDYWDLYQFVDTENGVIELPPDKMEYMPKLPGCQEDSCDTFDAVLDAKALEQSKVTEKAAITCTITTPAPTAATGDKPRRSSYWDMYGEGWTGQETLGVDNEKQFRVNSKQNTAPTSPAITPPLSGDMCSTDGIVEEFFDTAIPVAVVRPPPENTGVVAGGASSMHPSVTDSTFTGSPQLSHASEVNVSPALVALDSRHVLDAVAPTSLSHIGVHSSHPSVVVPPPVVTQTPAALSPTQLASTLQHSLKLPYQADTPGSVSGGSDSGYVPSDGGRVSDPWSQSGSSESITLRGGHANNGARSTDEWSEDTAEVSTPIEGPHSRVMLSATVYIAEKVKPPQVDESSKYWDMYDDEDMSEAPMRHRESVDQQDMDDGSYWNMYD